MLCLYFTRMSTHSMLVAVIVFHIFIDTFTITFENVNRYVKDSGCQSFVETQVDK